MSNIVDGALLDMVLGILGVDGSNLFDGYGPAGVGTLVLDLENGFKVKHQWRTDVSKWYGGKERRAGINDSPQQWFSGEAYLGGDRPRAERARLARYAASGSQFLLGLPHEAMSIADDPSGTTIYVNPDQLQLCDWSNEGQRVVVVRLNDQGDNEFVDAIIQATDADSITLDTLPGLFGAEGGTIMPAVPIYLEPQQNFARYPVTVEMWQLEARAAMLTFAPARASLAIGPLTSCAGLEGAIVIARQAGESIVQFAMTAVPGTPAAGVLIESDSLVLWQYYTASTPQDLANALLTSQYVVLGGTWSGASALTVADSFGAYVPLTGGGATAQVGRGASLATYDGDGVVRAVWDRPLSVAQTATDSIHAMTQIIDHGALPYSIGSADDPDWGRAVAYLAASRAEWQWLKLFLSTVVGRQKAFWLATWRDDLTFVSVGVGTITVRTDDGSDFTAWYPRLREHIQIVESTGAITYAHITAAVDNHNGTRTLTVSAVPATANVTLISWLEFCRFESDEFDFTCGELGISVQTIARGVPKQTGDLDLPTEFNFQLNAELG